MSNFEVISALDIQNSLFVINFFLFLFLNLMALGLSHKASPLQSLTQTYCFSTLCKKLRVIDQITHPEIFE
jgi:hypothetical protein